LTWKKQISDLLDLLLPLLLGLLLLLLYFLDEVAVDLHPSLAANTSERRSVPILE
jgi:hypothetical protein